MWTSSTWQTRKWHSHTSCPWMWRFSVDCQLRGSSSRISPRNHTWVPCLKFPYHYRLKVHYCLTQGKRSQHRSLTRWHQEWVPTSGPWSCQQWHFRFGFECRSGYVGIFKCRSSHVRIFRQRRKRSCLPAHTKFGSGRKERSPRGTFGTMMISMKVNDSKL